MLIPVDVNLMFKKIAMFNFYTLLSNYFNLNFPLNGINIMNVVFFKKFGYNCYK